MPATSRQCATPILACLLAAVTLSPLSRVRAEPPAGDKYALLVGVHQYDKNELRDLPYAEADMEALADVLKKAGYKRVVLMTQSEGAKLARSLPLAANIRKTLKGLLEDLSADDSVLVAFAGHGVQYKDEDDNYFCPMDAKLADKTTLVSLSEVYKELEKSGAGTRLLLADCCRNDPRSDNARAVDRVKLESVTRPQRALPPGGVAAFFSCSAGEKAYEDAGIKHGVFFHFIIEGLQGKADQDKDGEVDLDELVSYTKKQVRDFVKDTYGDDVRQMPELVGKTRGQMMLTKLLGGVEKHAHNVSKLALSHARATFGLWGPARPDEKILPGDILFISYDVEGIAVDKDGKAHYSTGMEIEDAKGKVLFKEEPLDREASLDTGSDIMPLKSRVTIGTDTAPGDYTVTITLIDHISSRSQTLKQPFQVLPSAFGLIQVQATNEKGIPVALHSNGERVLITFMAVGFARAGDAKQPDVSFEMRVLDETGQPIRGKPAVLEVNKDVPADSSYLPLQIPLSLNRAGIFTIELTASDQIAGKKTKLSLPLTVQEAK